jgi:predicted dehydrogenase
MSPLPAPTRSIGIAVVGFGWMGQAHARSARRAPTHFADRAYQPRLVVCADVDPGRREQAERDWGFERSTADWRAAIEAPDVDAVWITAPNMMHVEFVEAAAAAGKAVFCEKPVGGRPEDVARARAATAEAGVLTGVGYNYRWAPLVQHARALIAAGALGRITHYRGRFFSMYGSDPMGLLSWRFRLEEGGYGTSSDLLSHSVDLGHFLLGGSIQRLVGTRSTTITERPLATGAASHYGRGRPGDPTGEVTNEDFVSMLAEFPDRVTAVFESSRAIVGPESQNAFEIYGTEGALAWNLERMNELQVCRAVAGEDGLRAKNTGWTTVYGGDRFPYHGNFVPGNANGIGFEDLVTIEDHEFLQAVATGGSFAPGLDEAADFAAVQAALITSWQTGSWADVVPLDSPAVPPGTPVGPPGTPAVPPGTPADQPEKPGASPEPVTAQTQTAR